MSVKCPNRMITPQFETRLPHHSLCLHNINIVSKSLTSWFIHQVVFKKNLNSALLFSRSRINQACALILETHVGWKGLGTRSRGFLIGHCHICWLKIEGRASGWNSSMPNLKLLVGLICILPWTNVKIGKACAVTSEVIIEQKAATVFWKAQLFFRTRHNMMVFSPSELEHDSSSLVSWPTAGIIMSTHRWIWGWGCIRNADPVGSV